MSRPWPLSLAVPTMRRILLSTFCLMLTLSAYAAEPTYPREISRWQEIIVPPDSDRVAHAEWFFAADYSSHEWRVFAEGGRICAELTTGKPPAQRDRPKFTPRIDRFVGASPYARFARVEDGWLVGFNQGEFGGALYWFSPDGQRNYKVSDHQIVDFLSLPNGLYAIEGMAHIMISEGSVIRISRSQPNARWQATTFVKLPFAPDAVSLSRDNAMLITLSDALVRVGEDGTMATLVSDPPWAGLYPNSSVLSPGEKKLYIGMREFVGEFDIPTKKLRMLIPSAKFLNKLSKEDEMKIREQYGDQQGSAPNG